VLGSRLMTGRFAKLFSGLGEHIAIIHFQVREHFLVLEHGWVHVDEP
jgi:hypothetical protein